MALLSFRVFKSLIFTKMIQQYVKYGFISVFQFLFYWKGCPLVTPVHGKIERIHPVYFSTSKSKIKIKEIASIARQSNFVYLEFVDFPLFKIFLKHQWKDTTSVILYDSNKSRNFLDVDILWFQAELDTKYWVVFMCIRLQGQWSSDFTPSYSSNSIPNKSKDKVHSSKWVTVSFSS